MRRFSVRHKGKDDGKRNLLHGFRRCYAGVIFHGG
jgi:hypothetical protein